ncbi:MAG: hypothetical protein WD042_02200 [Phycisphaeraceae bacterium]
MQASRAFAAEACAAVGPWLSDSAAGAAIDTVAWPGVATGGSTCGCDAGVSPRCACDGTGPMMGTMTRRG